MVKKISDLLIIDEVTYIIRDTYKKPVITMGMGDIGKISRITTSMYGNDVIFAHSGMGSAPGQILYEKMIGIVELFY